MGWLAVDKDGTWFIYKDKPQRNFEDWHTFGGNCMIISDDSFKDVFDIDLSWEDEPREIIIK